MYLLLVMRLQEVGVKMVQSDQVLQSAITSGTSVTGVCWSTVFMSDTINHILATFTYEFIKY